MRYLRLDRSDGGPEGEAAFAEGLEPDTHDLVVTKYGLSAFAGTGLSGQLPVGSHLVVAGVATEAGVMASVLDALTDHSVSVVVDAVTRGSEAGHSEALQRMEAAGASMIRLREILGESSA